MDLEKQWRRSQIQVSQDKTWHQSEDEEKYLRHYKILDWMRLSPALGQLQLASRDEKVRN